MVHSWPKHEITTIPTAPLQWVLFKLSRSSPLIQFMDQCLLHGKGIFTWQFLKILPTLQMPWMLSKPFSCRSFHSRGIVVSCIWVLLVRGRLRMLIADLLHFPWKDLTMHIFVMLCAHVFLVAVKRNRSELYHCFQALGQLEMAQKSATRFSDWLKRRILAGERLLVRSWYALPAELMIIGETFIVQKSKLVLLHQLLIEFWKSVN